MCFIALTFAGHAQLVRAPNTTTNAFPGLIFTNPICLVSPPGETNRLLVLSKNGGVTIITNRFNGTGGFSVHQSD